MTEKRPLRVLAVLVPASIVLAGCGAGLLGPVTAGEEFRTQDYVETAPAVHADASRAGLPPGAGSTLADYLDAALERNPRLRAARRKAEAAGYRIAQARSLDDPILSVVPPTGDLTQTAAGQMDGSVGISQKIPFPSKLAVRGRVAGHERAEAEERYRGVMFEVVAEVRRAYFTLYFADRAIKTTRESQRLLRSLREIASKKYEAGLVPQQDVLRALVELTNLENELVRLGALRDIAEARLARLMALPVDTALPVTEPIEMRTVSPALREMLAGAEGANPEIAAAKARLEKAREGLELAKLDYVPDFIFGYTYTGISDSGLSMAHTGEDNWNFSLGFTVPIWFGRMEAHNNEAMSELAASREGLAAVRDDTAFRIESTLASVYSQQRLTELFGKVVIPQATQTLDATVVAYRAGSVEFLTLIENWRRLLDFEIAHQKSLSEYEQALAELDRLIGSEPGLPSRQVGVRS